MGLDHSLVGVPSEPQVRSWDSKDALLYAVGVGAGLGDPLRELEFTTENCQGIEQKVLPTFAVLLAQARAGRSGLSVLTTMGNECLMRTVDVLDYLVEDEATRVICLFLEETGDPAKFPRVAEKRTGPESRSSR